MVFILSHQDTGLFVTLYTIDNRTKKEYDEKDNKRYDQYVDKVFTS